MIALILCAPDTVPVWLGSATARPAGRARIVERLISRYINACLAAQSMAPTTWRRDNASASDTGRDRIVPKVSYSFQYSVFSLQFTVYSLLLSPASSLFKNTYTPSPLSTFPRHSPASFRTHLIQITSITIALYVVFICFVVLCFVLFCFVVSCILFCFVLLCCVECVSVCVWVCVLCSGVVAHNKLLTNDSSVRALNSNEKRTKRRVRNSRKVENWKSGRKAAAKF